MPTTLRSSNTTSKMYFSIQKWRDVTISSFKVILKKKNILEKTSVCGLFARVFFLGFFYIARLAVHIYCKDNKGGLDRLI